MARLTASDMVDIVRDSLGGETSETLSDARILRYINQSYLELCSSYGFDQLQKSDTFTTTSGTVDYELSFDDIIEIHALIDETNKFTLWTMNEFEYNEYTQGNAQSGSPSHWLIHGVGDNDRWKIRLWPTPNGTYTVRVHYAMKPTELVQSPTATSPIIPEQWDDSIIYRAVARGWAMLGDDEKATSWRRMARSTDQAAYQTTYHPSRIKTRIGSRVGSALRDV